MPHALPSTPPTLEQRRSSCHGFTLVELLVVLAILSLLMGLLLPALKTVKESSRTSRCLANLRQVGMAIVGYTHDQEGYLPPGSISTLQTTYGASGWPGKLALEDLVEIPRSASPPGGLQNSPFICPSTIASYAPSNAGFDYTVKANASEDEPQMMTLFTWGPTLGIFGITSYVGHGAYNGNTSATKHIFDELHNALGQVTRTKTLSSFDRQAKRPAIWDGTALMHNGGIARIAARHQNRTKTNFVFLDGHADGFNTFTTCQPAYKVDFILEP